MAKHDPVADAKRRLKAKNARRKNNPKTKGRQVAVGRGKQRTRTKKKT